MKHLSRKLLSFVFLVLAALPLAGCGAKFQNITPPDTFLGSQNNSIGLIWIYPATEDGIYSAQHTILGNNGLLDIAVANAFAAEIKTALSKIVIDEQIKKYFINLFQPAFKNIGFKTIVNIKPYCVKEFRLGKNKFCTNSIPQTDQKFLGLHEYPQFEPEFDFKPVFAELDVDYLLAVWVAGHGTGRNYYAGIPTSPPKGTTAVISFLIERQSGQIIAKYLSSVVEPVAGEWDQPPEYTNLMTAVHKSFEAAMDEIYIDIFKQAP